ncbi:hypothetical protein K439DRAFT_1372098 [Ramaria rubella]|nr:hypothetical protein K439DRAFT_1372098 [Ramaria rubella]
MARVCSSQVLLVGIGFGWWLLRCGLAYVSFWGGTGTGKSVLLRHVIGVLHGKYRKLPGAVAVMATTGLVACNVSGTTVHAWAGIGLGCGSVDSLVHKVRACNNGATQACWLQTRALVVDESEWAAISLHSCQRNP